MDQAAIPPETGNRVNELLEVLWICNSISFVIFSLRILTRWKITRNLGMQDCILTIGVVSSQSAVRLFCVSLILIEIITADLACGWRGSFKHGLEWAWETRLPLDSGRAYKGRAAGFCCRHSVYWEPDSAQVCRHAHAQGTHGPYIPGAMDPVRSHDYFDRILGRLGSLTVSSVHPLGRSLEPGDTSRLRVDKRLY